MSVSTPEAHALLRIPWGALLSFLEHRRWREATADAALLRCQAMLSARAVAKLHRWRLDRKAARAAAQRADSFHRRRRARRCVLRLRGCALHRRAMRAAELRGEHYDVTQCE